LHVEYGPPALAVGAAWIVNVAFDVAGLAHGDTGFAVHVNVRVPAVMSAALGVYVVLASVALPNVPVPLEDHMPDDECVDVAEISTGLLAHVEYGPPALAVGVPWIVSVAFDAAVPVQGEIDIAVQVRITLPARLSPALGEYVVDRAEAFANEPPPLVVHMPDEKLVDVAVIGTGPLPTHVEYGPPAKLVNVPWIVSSALDTAGLAHGAVGFAVHVNVTLPAVLSAPLGEYVVIADAALANVPDPLVDHIRTVEFEDVAAIETGPEPAHVEYGPPALAVGPGCTMSTAAFEVVVPHAPVTTTSYEPASETVALEIVYDG
jgi:hypothetical protein